MLLWILVFGVATIHNANCSWEIVRRKENAGQVFSPCLDTFQNNIAGNGSFCTTRYGVCKGANCKYCRCKNTSDVFMSYDVGCVSNKQLEDKMQSNKCFLHSPTFQFIPTIHRNMSNTNRYQLYRQQSLSDRVLTKNMECTSRKVFNVYGNKKLKLYDNPTGSRIQIYSSVARKDIQFNFSSVEMQYMSGMLVYVEIHCSFRTQKIESCFLFKVEGAYNISSESSVPSTTYSTTLGPVTSTSKEDDGPDMEMIKAVVIVGCILLVFLLVLIYFLYRRRQYNQQLRDRAGLETVKSDTVTSWGDAGYTQPTELPMTPAYMEINAGTKIEKEAELCNDEKLATTYVTTEPPLSEGQDKSRENGLYNQSEQFADPELNVESIRTNDTDPSSLPNDEISGTHKYEEVDIDPGNAENNDSVNENNSDNDMPNSEEPLGADYAQNNYFELEPWMLQSKRNPQVGSGENSGDRQDEQNDMKLPSDILYANNGLTEDHGAAATTAAHILNDNSPDDNKAAENPYYDSADLKGEGEQQKHEVESENIDNIDTNVTTEDSDVVAASESSNDDVINHSDLQPTDTARGNLYEIVDPST